MITRYIKCAAGVSALVLLFTACSQSAATYQLAYNYEEGDRLAYRTEMTGDILYSSQEGEHNGIIQAGFLLTQEVTQIDEDGIYDIKNSMEQFKMSMEADGEKTDMPVMFDNLSYSVKMDKYGKAYSVEGLDDLFSMGIETPIDMDQMIDNSKPSLPDYPVKTGDTWENTMEIPIPGFDQPLTGNIIMKLEAVEQMDGKEVAKISSFVELPLDMKYNLRDAMEGGGKQIPSLEGIDMSDIIVEVKGYEKVESISYITLDKGITISSEGKIAAEITTVSHMDGQEQEVIMNMDATMNMTLIE